MWWQCWISKVVWQYVPGHRASNKKRLDNRTLSDINTIHKVTDSWQITHAIYWQCRTPACRGLPKKCDGAWRYRQQWTVIHSFKCICCGTWSKYKCKYKCEFIEHDYVNTSNALSPWVSGEQRCLQVPPKLFEVDSWIPQTIGQWIPDC